MNVQPEDMNKLAIQIVENKGGALVCPSGRIDIDSSPAFRDQLLALLRGRPIATLRIDLSAVTSIDSSGLATLIEALRIAHAGKTGLRLQGLHDELLRIFQFTGFLSLFDGSSQVMTQSGGEVI
jgi:anti-sigma B factor antagonist